MAQAGDLTMSSAALPSLDAILKAQAARKPDAVALVDPPDCEHVTGQSPRRFSYAQADRAVGAIAARLHEIGLPHGSVVGMQMPNVASGILALLGIMRAGMIPAPLPLLWRVSDCVAALSESGARALVTCGRVGAFDHAALSLEIAAELFPIRVVCGFNCAATDGIVPLDDLLSDPGEHPDAILFQEMAHAPFGLVTFEMTAGGVIPVARDVEKLLAGGRLARQRGGIGPDAKILTTLPAASFAGVSSALVPWLLSGGTLVLHHAFDPDILHDQIEREGCDTLVVPDAMLPGLCASGWLQPDGIRSVIAVWRAPERLSAAPQWTSLDTALVDVAAFGETAMLAARRPPSGRSAPWPAGPVTIAHGGPDCADIAITPRGTLGIGGALAAPPFEPFGNDPNAASSSAVGHIDTGFTCRAAEDNGLIVTAPPAGLVAVGGYRFALRDLQYMVREIDGNGVLAALPHSLAGHRLAGHSSDPVTMRDVLQTMGINPLLTAAFRDRAA
ncbi:MAG: AMP-binding protein [Pseudorhodoplanes sp.]